MSPTLANAILRIYGESPVLDPMAGIGTTLVESVLLGMDAIGVELERKFVNQANENIRHVRKDFADRKLGNAKCLQGDARLLSKYNLRNFSSIVFSPPYSTTNTFKDLAFVMPRENKPIVRPSAVHYESPDSINKISNYGKINSILFSPPYANALDGNRHYRIHNGAKVYDKITDEKNLPKAYTLADNENIGNLDYGQFNSIVFSPPYGEQHGKGGSIFNADGTVTAKFKDKFHSSGIRRQGFLDATSNGNIDNVKYGRSYLSEMLKVYSECFRVLAPSKFMVVVVKDIRRNSLTIPLAADTIKLCQAIGFQLYDIIINKTYFPSFWTLNRAKRDLAKGIMHPLRNHEYVLVFKKDGF